MPQTRMFRDRVVSMEQTLEGGEKHLEFLKALCREAFPDFEYREHFLEHERDLFVIALEAPDGRRKLVSWTRMVLFDTERLPSLVENPISPLRSRILAFLQARVARPEIVVTFRHLEDGWVDTPEPRREKRRGRRGGGGRERPAVAAVSAEKPGSSRGTPGAARPDSARGARGGRGRSERDRSRGGAAPPPKEGRPGGSPPVGGRPPVGAAAAPGDAPGADAGPEAGRPGGRRRRFRRRRRGRGGAGPAGGGAPGGGGPAGKPPQ